MVFAFVSLRLLAPTLIPPYIAKSHLTGTGLARAEKEIR